MGIIYCYQLFLNLKVVQLLNPDHISCFCTEFKTWTFFFSSTGFKSWTNCFQVFTQKSKSRPSFKS